MRKLTNNANQTTAQQQFIAAANQNPRKPWFSVQYRNDLLKFTTPVENNVSSYTSVPFMYKALDAANVLVAGYDENHVLRAGTTTYDAVSVSAEPVIVASGYEASVTGTWSGGRYYFIEYMPSVTDPETAVYSVNSAGANKTLFHTPSGLPGSYKYPYNQGGANMFGETVRPSAFLLLEHGDRIAVYTSYKYINGINQYVCTMNFYHAVPNSNQYRRLRTTIQYDLPYIDTSRNYAKMVTLDPSAGCVFGMSTAAGKFFIVANDGTKAVRFTYNLGVEGMLEPIIPIDLDANRLEITDSSGVKTYGKYHQFMPHALTKIGSKYYLNGRMIRTYSNGDQNVMEVYLWSDNGVNWAVGDVSFFIDSKYYKKGNAVRNYFYSLVHPSEGSTAYALGNNCKTSAPAREIDRQISGTEFTEIIVEGQIQNQANSADLITMMAMRGFSSIDPSVLGGKTITLNLGYYDASNTVLPLKIGEYFVDSEAHELSNVGRGPNRIAGMDAGAWKLTRWSSITDVDRWSSSFIKDDLKKLSKLIVKGISSDYKAVDNAKSSGLHLSNLNDPFVGYTSTKDDRDGMFTVCAKFTDTGSTVKLSSIGLLIGAEDYTDIYTNGLADRKGWNAYMIPAASTWTGQAEAAPQMRKSNLKRRADDPLTKENESDVDRAYQWIRRYTSLWKRSVYLAEGSQDSSYNTITAAAATGSNNVIYSANFAAVHGVDYEFVVRKQSGRMQLYQRKKGFTSSTITASTHTGYTLIHEYQFGKDDRINWGPRPYWGFVANTDVFTSLDGWNSREYGNIETSLTEAYNVVDTVNKSADFPDSRLASLGNVYFVAGTGSYVTTSQTTSEQVWVDREPSSGGGYWDTVTTTTSSQQWVDPYNVASNSYIVEMCAVSGMTLSVGEIVRCFAFTDLGGAVNENNCTANIIRTGESANTIGRSEFFGVINAIENINHEGSGIIRRKISFGKTWGGGIPQPGSGENYKYAIYKAGSSSVYAKASSGTIYSSVVTGFDAQGQAQYLNLDIKNGTVKQSSTTAGRAAIVNRQNDAISLRMMESDGSTHLMYSGSAQTGLGYDWPTNPISNTGFVGNAGFVSTRDWRLLMNQGRLFPFSSTTLGLPGGEQKSYMIKGEEIIRYNNWGWKSRGSSTTDIVWCIISAYYTPIFPSVKGQTEIQQWSKLSGSTWIEPGDKFNLIPNLSGLRLYINGKGGSYTAEGDVKQYAVSAVAANGGTASKLTFTPKLSSGADSMDPGTERAKDEDKQLKEIAILSGREQFGTSSGIQSYTDPLCFYPVGSNTTEVPDSFIKVNYWTMNAGLYNSAKDNLEYVCNLAGISDVQFMDKTGIVANSATSTVYAATTADPGLANFVLEMSATVVHESQITAQFRDAYRVLIRIDNPTSGNFSGRGMILLTLQASHSSLASGYNTIATVSVPVADIPIVGQHDFRLAVRKERVIVEMNSMPLWSFDLNTYTFGGDKNDATSLFTDARAPVLLTASTISSGVSYTLVELSEEVENQIIDMSQGGGEAIQFVTKERHIHTRSTQDGGLQFGKFMDGNREEPATGAEIPTENYIKDQLEYNPFQVPGHVLVTGAEYGEHIDPEWIRQNGYMFNTNQNRLLDTVEDSVKEAKLLIRMMKEDSDNSDMEIIGLPHIQPEDGITKTYSYPTQEAVSEQQIVTGHSIQFDQSTMKSMLKIRKKYSLE